MNSRPKYGALVAGEQERPSATTVGMALPQVMRLNPSLVMTCAKLRYEIESLLRPWEYLTFDLSMLPLTSLPLKRLRSSIFDITTITSSHEKGPQYSDLLINLVKASPMFVKKLEQHFEELINSPVTYDSTQFI